MEPMIRSQWCAAVAFAAVFAALPVLDARTEPVLDDGTASSFPPDMQLSSPQEGVLPAAAPITLLSRGRWPEACSSARRILALRIADTEALGVFALCAALAGDDQATSLALERLRESRDGSHFTLLAEGVRELKAGRADAAAARFHAALRLRADDPLAQYFRGETLRAVGQDRQAIAAFEAVLKTWPEHVPAMTAAARLLAATAAGGDDVLAARAFAERATLVDPWTRTNWILLAELCRRTGQTERAEAIALQWLRMPAPMPAR